MSINWSLVSHFSRNSSIDRNSLVSRNRNTSIFFRSLIKCASNLVRRSLQIPRGGDVPGNSILWFRINAIRSNNNKDKCEQEWFGFWLAKLCAPHRESSSQIKTAPAKFNGTLPAMSRNLHLLECHFQILSYNTEPCAAQFQNLFQFVRPQKCSRIQINFFSCKINTSPFNRYASHQLLDRGAAAEGRTRDSCDTCNSAHRHQADTFSFSVFHFGFRLLLF